MSTSCLNKLLLLLVFIPLCYFQICTPVGAATTLPPQVISTFPASGGVIEDVTAATISAQFDLPLNTATVNTTTFIVKDQNGTPVTGSVVYDTVFINDVAVYQATFTPTTFLSAGGIYTATVTTGVQSADGTPLTADYSWNVTMNPYLGGVANEGNLLITPLGDGRIGLYRYISPDGWVWQVFDWDSKGSRLQISGGEVPLGYFLGYIYNNNQQGFYGSDVPPALIANSQLNSSQTKTEWTTASGLRIIQELTYQPGAAYYGLNWKIVNESTTDISDLRFFHGEDTYFLGVDSGAGFWDAANNTVGVQRTYPPPPAVGTEQRRMSLQAITPPYAYDSEDYYLILGDRGNVMNGALTNTIDPSEETDNGYALEWRNPLLQAGTFWNISAFEKLADVPIGSVSVTAPVTTVCTAGVNCTLKFALTNSTIYQANVNLTLTPSRPGWTATTSSTAVTIPAPVPPQIVSSLPIDVELVIPSGETDGIIGQLTLTAIDGQAIASDSAAIYVLNPVSYSLTTTASGTGSGTVSTYPEAGPYLSGTSVQLLASPAPHSSFIGWSGDCIGTANPFPLVMDANKNCSANFAIDTFSITATAATGGTISPSGATAVNYGADQAYTVFPTTGYHIVDVKVDGVSQGAITTYSFNSVTAAHTIDATFAINSYILTATASTGGTISPSSATTVNYGANQTYAITPTTGYHIVDVKVDGVSQGAITTYNFNSVTSAHTIDATFAINTFTVTATAGTGGTISPSGVTTVNFGADQNYTVSPTTGYHIVDVKVDGVSQGAISSYNFTSVTDAHTIDVTFAINTYGITATAGSGGSVTPAGTTSVNFGAGQAYTITPTTGYHIVDVKVDGVSQGAITSYSFTSVTAPHTIDATFAINSYTLNTAIASGSGSIALAPAAAQYNHGSTVQLSANPVAGWSFSVWGGDCSGNITPFTLTMDAAKSCSAAFAIIQYSITATAGSGGTISPGGATAVNHGTGQSYSITPTSGYHVVDVKVDGVSQGAITSYNFSNVTAAHTIDATFAINTNTVIATAGSGGTISPGGATAVNFGNGQTYSITPDSGYHVVDVKVDGTSQGAVTTYSFTSVTAAHTIDVTFAINTYSITASTANSGGTISPAGVTGFNSGAAQSYTITPASGHVVMDVKVDGQSVGSLTGYLFSNLTASHTIAATFAPDGILDPNSDGRLSINDALLALKIAMGQNPGLELTTAQILQHADAAPLVNGLPQPDGKIDLGDVLLLLRRVVGLANW